MWVRHLRHLWKFSKLLYCTSDYVHELGKVDAKRGQATRCSIFRRVIMSLRIPTINERELDPQMAWKKRTNETMDTEKRYPREPRIIYLFDLNNKSEDESSLLLSLSFSFFLELQFLSLASFSFEFSSFRFRRENFDRERERERKK